MKRILILIFIALCSNLSAQEVEYNMSDTIVDDCIGTLYDSGGLGSIYDNNENFTFTIETEGVISISFLNEFCLDDGFDFLSIYDGPDTGSPLLATYTGTTLPPGLTANSGAVTFFFTSDANASYCGWNIHWSTEVTPPEEPIFTFDNPSCDENLVLVFDEALQIPTWAMEDAIITVNGAYEHEIDDVLVSGPEIATEVELIFDDPIEYNCNFDVELDIYLPDQCDSLWHFIITESFLMSNCPFIGSINVVNDSICEGECIDLELEIPSSTCFDYTYSWNNGLPPTEGPHTVCPLSTTTYIVDITEIGTGNEFTEEITIEVTAGTSDQEDVTICATGSIVELLIEDPGAYWFGLGIIDEINGVFDPDSADVGDNTVYYQASSVCIDSITVSVLPIESGDFVAACPGSDPFLLNPFPSGGIWSGPNVSPEGLYDPSSEGTFQLFYDLDGCLDTTTVNVGELITTTDLGIRCQSDIPEYIAFEPLGGTWTGEGIIDELYGQFDPGEMSEGNQQFLYEINGCDQLINIEILPIYTGGQNQNSCPSQEPYVPFTAWSPTGGYWEGDGIIDQDNFIYDPGSIPDDYWSTMVYYAPNECTDTIFMYNRTTEIGPDTVRFCIEDNDFLVNNETVGRTPWGGVWSGGNFYFVEDEGDYFSPSATGVGEHLVSYSNNGCSDSSLFIVYPSELPLDSLAFCSNNEAVELIPGIPSGAQWSGPGIIDSNTGLFDPNLAGDDDIYVYWNTSTNCMDSVYIYIEEFEPATISDLDPIYCFQNTDFPIGLEPQGGILTGSLSDEFFNPANEGQGEYFLNYTYTTALCSSYDTMSIIVHPELEGSLTSSDNLICPNSSSILSVISNGGAPGELYSYEWSDGLFPIDVNTVTPEVSTTYYVTVFDGCSDPLLDSILVEVLPPIQIDVSTNDTICFDLDGFATVDVLNEGDFELAWGFNQEIIADTFYTTAGQSAALLVSDLINGCTFDTVIFTPSYTPIVALFSLNPNEECIPGELNPITFIDLSEHGITGVWDFGNDEILDYNPSINPSVEIEPGQYTVNLYIENEGNCPDSASMDICVLPASRLFIPDIFSPNEDNNNDVLFVRGQGIVSMNFMIFDGWGGLIFESSDKEQGWDGKRNGIRMPEGIYVYKLDVELNNGERIQMTGDITLVR